MSRDFRKARKGVTWRDMQDPKLAEAMLRPIQEIADRSQLAQTAWPSKNYGKNFVGTDCLLTSIAACFWGDKVPELADPQGEPLVTVLPRGYFPVWTDGNGDRWLCVQNEAPGDLGYHDVPLDGQEPVAYARP